MCLLIAVFSVRVSDSMRVVHGSVADLALSMRLVTYAIYSTNSSALERSVWPQRAPSWQIQSADLGQM
jgi:hypothetical protein